jgi:hypothetical protein
MKLGIMQPYLFPYLGYLQLVAAVDTFVFYDDVQFIKNGWINRNRLALGGEVRYFTVPLAGAGSSLGIRDVRTQPAARWRDKLMESLRHGYARAPHYAAVRQLVGDVLATDTTRIATLAARSVTDTARYLGLDTRFVPSSIVYDNSALKGPARVLDICVRERADHYLNLPGGRALYDPRAFDAAGVTLGFIEPELWPYRQSGADFLPGLSIIDVLMFNPADTVRARLMDVARS